MYIGLSLSMCVRDLYVGAIKARDVLFILSGTLVRDGDWERVFENYRQHYWRDSPEGMTQLARELISQGRVCQARLDEEFDSYSHMYVGSGHWAEVVNNYRVGLRENR